MAPDDREEIASLNLLALALAESGRDHDEALDQIRREMDRSMIERKSEEGQQLLAVGRKRRDYAVASGAF